MDSIIIFLGKRNYNLTSEKDLRTMCRQCGLPDKAHILKSKKERKSAHHVPTMWTARRQGTHSQKSKRNKKKRKICAPFSDNVDCQTGHTFSKVLSTGIHTHTHTKCLGS